MSIEGSNMNIEVNIASIGNSYVSIEDSIASIRI